MAQSNTSNKSISGCVVAIIVALIGAFATLVAADKLPFPKINNTASTVSDKKSYSGEISEIWLKSNPKSRAIEVHLSFNVKNLRDQGCYVRVFFYDSSGKALVDTNHEYDSNSGYVLAITDFTPPYAETYYSDFTVIVPYDELHIDGAGGFDLILEVLLHYNGDDFAYKHLNFIYYKEGIVER